MSHSVEIELAIHSCSITIDCDEIVALFPEDQSASVVVTRRLNSSMARLSHARKAWEYALRRAR